jgi:photosystem II stability/assembly factor-like uncharacterized protein
MKTATENFHSVKVALLFALGAFVGLPGLVEAQENSAFFQDLSYRQVGPSRGGAVTTVAGHPSHPYTFYMGIRGGGGVWKTENYGQNWFPVTDGFIRTSSTMGAVRVAPSDPNIVYAGTGTDGIRSNIIGGRGIYKTTDAGETWEFLGLESTGQIGAVEVHPDNANHVYVAALGSPFGPNDDRGVYRSSDGGRSWDHVLFLNDSVGGIDLEIHPANPNTIYVAMYRGDRKPWTIISGCGPGCGDGIWKSTDGGDNWRQVTTGLPQGLIGKIDLAVSPAAANRVYALVEAPEPEEGLYRSDDSGETWRFMSGGRYPEDDPEGLVELTERPFYYTNVDADPTNADIVWVNNERFFKSVDGGLTWVIVPTPHGDNHDMWINPENPDIFVQSNDGGANVTLDGGKTWSTQFNQPTAELYQVDVDDRFPYWLYAGQQDNTTIAVPSLPPAQPAPAGPTAWWKAIGGCETGPAVPKPGSDIVYAPCKGTFDRFSFTTGQAIGRYVGAQHLYGVNPSKLKYRFQRTTPVEISPHNPDIVYHGSQYVHRSYDGGITWDEISPDLTANMPNRQIRAGEPITNDITGEEHFSVIYVIEESPTEAGVIWSGSNDGPVYVTRDHGTNWANVTPPMWPEEGRINSIEPSPHARGTAYVAGYRFRLNDFHPYVFKTADYGASWTLLTDGSNGIPADYPVRVVREDKKRAGLLYAGTEYGMFVSFDDGGHWQEMQLDMPRTPITDIEWVRNDLAMSTMGRGFWILDNVTPLQQLTDEVQNAEAHLYEPREAYRMRYQGTMLRGGVRSHDPEFLDPGAIIDYSLASTQSGDVTLEIMDGVGNVLRGFSSSSEGYVEPGNQERRAPYLNRLSQPRLETGAGHHRFTWDLRHPGSTAPASATGLYGRPGGNGPMVAPGHYQVRLTVGSMIQTQDLEVRIDPRVYADGISPADLQAQEQLSLQIRDAVAAAGAAAGELGQHTQQVSGGSSDAERIDELWSELITRRTGSYPPPMLLDQIDYLYGMVTKADSRPSRDAFTRYAELKEMLDTLLEEVRQLQRGVAEDR